MGSPVQADDRAPRRPVGLRVPGRWSRASGAPDARPDARPRRGAHRWWRAIRPTNTRVLCRSRNSANGARLVNARRADRGSPHAGSALLDVRASQSCARGRVSRKIPAAADRGSAPGSPTGATAGPRWRDDHGRGQSRDRTWKGPGFAPGARGSTGRGRPIRRRPGSRPPARPSCARAWPASGSARASRRAPRRWRDLARRPALGRLAGQGRLAQRARVLVPVGLAHPAEAVLLARLGRELLGRRLVRLDPELRRPDALPQVRHLAASSRSPPPIWRSAAHPSRCRRDDARPKIASRRMTAKTPVAAAPTTAWRNRITGSGRGGTRPAARQPGELADPPQGAAGRPRRGARPGRLGPAGPRQSALPASSSTAMPGSRWPCPAASRACLSCTSTSTPRKRRRSVGRRAAAATIPSHDVRLGRARSAGLCLRTVIPDLVAATSGPRLARGGSSRRGRA